MQMWDAFPRIGPAVNYDAKTVFEFELFCNFGRGQQQVTQQFTATCLGIEQTWQHSLRNNQDMDRRLRVDIPKRNQVFFFQDNVSWNFTGDDFLENRHGLTKRAL